MCVHAMMLKGSACSMGAHTSVKEGLVGRQEGEVAQPGSGQPCGQLPLALCQCPPVQHRQVHRLPRPLRSPPPAGLLGMGGLYLSL